MIPLVRKYSVLSQNANLFDQPLTVLVGVDLQKSNQTLEELNALSQTAGLIVVARLIQKREAFHPKYYIGEGKLQELKTIVEENKITLMITDDELTPSQNKALEQELKIKVIDRTGLILDIFAKNAKTYESQLQVELAQLEYLMPRLTRLWTHLSRLGGGGVGTRGPGEKQLEVDKRQIRHRIDHIKSKLKKIVSHRDVIRQNRKGIGKLKCAIIGYTNAGKSSLLNALTNAEVLVEDKLFATLDPTTRAVQLPNKETLILTDTVGFIQKLPHQLVQSFRATLEETQDADMLLHVIDASSPDAETHIKTSQTILKEIKADQIPQLYVFNKVDKKHEHFSQLLKKYTPNVLVSAKTGEGLLEMLSILEKLRDHLQSEVDVVVDYSQVKLIDQLYQNAQVLEIAYEENGIKVRAKMNKNYAEKWLSQLYQK